jgi:hypothetical protein
MKRDAAICTMRANKRPGARARLTHDALIHNKIPAQRAPEPYLSGFLSPALSVSAGQCVSAGRSSGKSLSYFALSPGFSS